MKHITTAAAVALLFSLSIALAGPGAPTVGYLSLAREKTPEDSAVAAWLLTNPKFSLKPLDLETPDPGTGLPDLAGIDVLWIHIPDSADYARWVPRFAELRPLKSWYEKGGRFLFTGLAAMIPHEIGMEESAPAIEAEDIENDWIFDQKGFQGYRPDISSPDGAHPVFNGLLGGTFTWDADSNHRLWTAGYSADNWPANGAVVAVEKAYITIRAERKLVVEYNKGAGAGIAAGGFINFRGRNLRRENMCRFVENALDYVAADARQGGGATAKKDPRYWNFSALKPYALSLSRATVDSLKAGLAGGEKQTSLAWEGPATGLRIARDSATDNMYDVANRRVLIMGKERGGIDEVWAHPFRLLRDYRAGIVSGDSVLWLDRVPARIEVRPEAFVRVYSTPAGGLKEIVFTAKENPSGVVHYEFGGTGSIRLAVKFRSDLRLMWPYDAPATGSLRYAYDSVSGTLVVSDEPGRNWGLFGADALPVARLSGQVDSIWWKGSGFEGRPSDANQLYHAAAYQLRSGTGLTFAFTGETGSGISAAGHAALLANPASALDSTRSSVRELLGNAIGIDSPDGEFDALFQWAIVGTDRFVVNTPGVGLGLLAGYSTTARGWDGAQKISGRPGYAWYFGRDAAWSGFAIDDYGDFVTVKAELEFMQKYQDLSGKIFHEISTSGSVHYDASDATPLYVMLATHYFRASGDTAFIRASWPHIRRAMDYLYSTDTDGDGLIENTNQGHGWVEGGALYPVHTEFYLAGAWGKALLDASFIASRLVMPDLSGKYRDDCYKVREILNRDFWNPQTRSFNLGKKADGTFNTEPTVLPATVMYYNLLDDDKVKPVLEQYAGPGFTTDWGVRIVSSASPLFNPQGYHYGSVWPLFTGWTALAEYEYGASTQGFTHILNNLYIKNHWALGFVEEVMSGAVYKPSGVCPHQCWSETNILHPAITGMIGWKPDAPDHAAGLYPRFPVQWDSVKVSNLRVGGAVLDVNMVRGATSTAYTLTVRGKGLSSLNFAPEIPEGMTITRILVDGREKPVPSGRKRGLIDPPILLWPKGETRLVIEHTGGIGVVPAMPRPEPGDSSTGYRIVSEEMRDGVYEIRLEGRAGTTAEIEVRTFDRSLGAVENASNVGEGKKGTYRLRVEFPKAATPYVAVTVKARTI